MVCLPTAGLRLCMTITSSIDIISVTYFGILFRPYNFLPASSSITSFNFIQFYLTDYKNADARSLTKDIFGSRPLVLNFEYTSEIDYSIQSDFLPLLILLLKSAVDSVSLLSVLPSIRLIILPRNPELISYFFLLVIVLRVVMLLRLDEQACVKKSSCFFRYAFYRSSDSFILFSISILYCWLWIAIRSCC